MIIKASTRGNAVALARHLLDTHDNDQIELFQIKGFLAHDVMGAMRELHAISMGVKSKRHLFSISLSPPENESVDTDVFEDAIKEVEEQNGLAGQPHVIIFHEKQGRRHCHLIVSRIDPETMTVKPLPFYKNRLQQIAKPIYLDCGWDLPKGFIDSRHRDVRNYDLCEGQQAKRIGRDPKQLKMLAQEAWASLRQRRSAAKSARTARPLPRARRPAFACRLTVEGEIFALPRLLNKSTKKVRERLKDDDALRSVEDTRTHIARIVVPKLKSFLDEAEREKARSQSPLEQQRLAMKKRHAEERRRMDAGLAAHQQAETRQRAERLRHGFRGLWDKLTGRYGKVREQNEREAWLGLTRDHQQRHALISVQLVERQALERQRQQVRENHASRVLGLHRDLARQQGMPSREHESTMLAGRSPLRCAPTALRSGGGALLWTTGTILCCGQSSASIHMPARKKRISIGVHTARFRASQIACAAPPPFRARRNAQGVIRRLVGLLRSSPHEAAKWFAVSKKEKTMTTATRATNRHIASTASPATEKPPTGSPLVQLGRTRTARASAFPAMPFRFRGASSSGKSRREAIPQREGSSSFPAIRMAAALLAPPL